MKTTIFKTRKFNGGTYVFELHTPDYVGEKGCLGVEITPYITVTTPCNDFGYEDTFIYNHMRKNGHYSWRSHPNWITKKLI